MENYFITIGGVGHWDNQEYVSKPEGYFFFQRVQSLHVEGELVIDDKIYTIKENQGMFIYPNVPHKFHPTKKKRWNVLHHIKSSVSKNLK